jgi:hypothetical protein
MRERVSATGKILVFGIVGLMASTALAATSAKTGWSINRVSSPTAGSYCTMAQKYADDTVITLAKNPNGQYSVAFDMPQKPFDASKGIPVSVRAGDKVVTSAARAQSENVLVVGLGSDAEFISAMESSGRLSLKVGEKNFDFEPAKVQTAAEQLSKCVASMNVPSVPSAPAAAPAPTAQKTQTVSSPIKAEVSQNQPTQADTLAAENARLKQALQEERARYQAPAEANTAAFSELQEKLRVNEAEIQKLREENQKLTAQAKAQPPQPLQPSPTETAKIASLESENGTLKTQIDALSKERDGLKAQLAAAPKTAQANPEDAKKLAELQKQNETLNAQIAQLQAEASKKAQPASIISPKVAEEQAQRIKALESENAALKAQINNIQTAASPNDDAELKTLRTQIAAMESKNNDLQAQLEEAVKQQEQSQIKSSGNNWDLEQATRRYQESQREIRRLGALIQEQKTACVQDKKNIESMLFDPAVAEKAQLVKFTEMEDRIAMLEGQLRATGIEPAAGNAAAPVRTTASSDLPVPTGVKVSAEPVAPVSSQKMEAGNNTIMRAPEIAAAPVASAVPTPSAALVPAPATPQQAKAALKFQSQQDFARLLKDAGVTAQDGVRPVQGANSDVYQAYRWKSNVLQGSAEQRTVASVDEYKAGVEQYLDRARSRCKGEFAAVPSQTSVAGGGVEQSAAYEIACVGGKANSTASVLFSYADGVMTTVAFEGKQDAMEQAIDARDRVAGQFGSLKTASR